MSNLVQSINLTKGSLIDIKVRAEDVPALFKAIGTLTIDEGETLHAMVKAQVAAASKTNNAHLEENVPPAKAAPDQNTEAESAKVEPEPEPEPEPEESQPKE